MNDSKLIHFKIDLPGFYFVFGPEGIYHGVGYYEASSESMDCLRSIILRREKSFITVQKAYESQDIFTLDGARYKRTKFPNEPENLRTWLDLKNLNFGNRSTDFKMLYSPNLLQKLIDDFKLLKPMYDFICTIEQRRKHDENGGKN